MSEVPLHACRSCPAQPQPLRNCSHGGRNSINTAMASSKEFVGCPYIRETLDAVQKFLAHKRTHITIEPPWNPRHRPTVGP